MSGDLGGRYKWACSLQNKTRPGRVRVRSPYSKPERAAVTYGKLRRAARTQALLSIPASVKKLGAMTRV
jgi:hypothetical protein